jgi:hypothetical protein
VSQQTVVAVAINLDVVAVILVGVLLWPLGRMPGHDKRQVVALALCCLHRRLGAPRTPVYGVERVEH